MSVIDWVSKDRSPEAEWLRTNCEPCNRYVFDNRGRRELKAWTLRDVPVGLEVTIAVSDSIVHAYCGNGVTTIARVDIPRGGKRRNALCEAIFWVKGFVAGFDASPTCDDD